MLFHKSEAAAGTAVYLRITGGKSVLNRSVQTFVRIAVQEVDERRREIELVYQLVERAVDRRRRRVGAVEDRTGIIDRYLLAIVPKLPVTEIAGPFDINSIRTLQGDALVCRELHFLPGWQNMVECNGGTEGELFSRTDVGAHLLEKAIGSFRHLRRGNRGWCARCGGILGGCFPTQCENGNCRNGTDANVAYRSETSTDFHHRAAPCRRSRAIFRHRL